MGTITKKIRTEVFEWNDEKALRNIQVHHVSFEEAATVFSDTNALYAEDFDHSDVDEERFNIIGISEKLRLLIVCHCLRSNDVIRIISARKATNEERGDYEQQLSG